VPIINSSDLENNKNLIYDVCIIGAGLSGQIVASKINNKKIIIVDSGKISFSKDVQNLNYIEMGGLGFRENNTNRVRQLGGSANMWANQLMYLDKYEIEDRNWLGENLSWPLSYDELKKNYSEVIRNIHGKTLENPFNNVDDKFFFSVLENEFLNEKNISFVNCMWPNKVEKYNINSKFTKKIIHNKNIDFISNFTATDFIINENKEKLTEIFFQSESKKISIKANIFVLACGAIENARILLNNKLKFKILDNKNLGKYFMDHVKVDLGYIRSKKKLPLSILLGIKYHNFDLRKCIKVSENFQKKKAILSCHSYINPIYEESEEILFLNFLKEIKKIIKLEGIPKFRFKKMNFKNILEQLYFKVPPQNSNSMINSFLRSILCKKNSYLSFNKLKVSFQGEQLPNINSKIFLSDKVDKYNQKIAIIDWKLDKIDYESQKEFIKILNNKFYSHNFLTFEENPNQKILDVSHHSGTTRMSNSKLDGVVDKNCKYHDLKNLYICGSSVFKTIGSGNTGLSIMAISNRLGNYLNKNLN
jgi:choline dehydrogenase-like flavoprotein